MAFALVLALSALSPVQALCLAGEDAADAGQAGEAEQPIAGDGTTGTVAGDTGDREDGGRPEEPGGGDGETGTAPETTPVGKGDPAETTTMVEVPTVTRSFGLVPQGSGDRPINASVSWESVKPGIEGLIGVGYTWGGCYPSTGFDCSGFIAWVEREVIGNRSFPSHDDASADNMEHWCADGGYTVVAVGDGWELPGSAHPGDLIFFYNSSTGTYVHAAIVGEGQTVYQSWGSEVHTGGFPYGVRNMSFLETMTDGSGSTPGAKRYDSWIIFRGLEEPGAVSVQKTDADTGLAQAQGGATLAGATFLLENTATGATWNLVTDVSGHARVDGLPLGDYTLREIAAPEGYRVNGTVSSFTLSSGSEATRTHEETVPDEVITENFEIGKIDQDTRDTVPNTEYTVYRYRNPDSPTAVPRQCGGEDEAGTWEEIDVERTDIGGTILLENLPYGCYRISETCPDYHYAECGESEESSEVSYYFRVDGTHPDGQNHVWENMKIELECNVDKETIDVTSAAFRTLPGDSLGFDNVTHELYRYDVAFDNGDTNVRADQYTVLDPCEFNREGIRLKELYTPVTENDTDGRFNLWYQTNRTDPTRTYSDASATSDNPPNKLSDGTDRIPTTGYRLWKQDLDCSERSHLAVSDLQLEEGEYVTALMLEYGSVDVGFKTREEEPLSYLVVATGQLDNGDGEVVIENSATSHITRNYSTTAIDEETGERVELETPVGLYDDDEDKVETRVIDTFLLDSGAGGLARTGDASIPLIVVLLVLTACGLVLMLVGSRGVRERVENLVAGHHRGDSGGKWR